MCKECCTGVKKYPLVLFSLGIPLVLVKKSEAQEGYELKRLYFQIPIMSVKAIIRANMVAFGLLHILYMLAYSHMISMDRWVVSFIHAQYLQYLISKF